MAFQLKRRGSIARQLRRLVCKEFRRALQELAHSKPGEEAIHEARKSVKKIRAVLHLLHDDLGSDYRMENRRLRRVAHRLSSLRDVDANAETLRALHGRYRNVVTPAITRTVARGLGARKRQARAGAGRLAVLATNELRRARKSTPDRIRRVGRSGAVRTGITRGYRRARQVMKSLSAESDATQFHLWRRRVKDHWYHMRLIAARHATARSRVRSVGKLEDWLGDDHNLAILRTTILAAPDRFGDARTTAVVLGCITRYQTWLRERALKLGRRLLAEKPGPFGESITAW